MKGAEEIGAAALAAAILGPHGAGSAEGRARQAFWRAATGGLTAPSPEIELQLARDIMALHGQIPAERLRARRGPMLDRAASGLRAAALAPPGLRFAPAPGDVVASPPAVPFAGFFAVEVLDLACRRFDGTMSAPFRREVFVACDAVTVLPYDPLRDRVLVIEQFRAGPLARGSRNPWQIEAVAGRVDAGETPEAAALRESREEAGLALGSLERVAEYHPSPGACSEYIYSFVGLCDLPDGAAGIHGLAAEAEDIRGHLLAAEDLIARLDASEITNAPLILTVQWLARHRPRLRDAAAAGPQI